ncbi:uncharacterized protein LY89DRAFT_734031 [Mollisia scopiformis]|uniref:BTB domain-containing protein n=1 Tax=Mollisia scopiformis TaxID=149040 RepID=A0A194XA72_MOLSC|nr:uncharacterized protein LY89DRAFT_734031 [Mollisia scopiformis]KUJ17039.1 hypothetical protein LY89DRAFT_734031 [Mollisia scopiformis]
MALVVTKSPLFKRLGDETVKLVVTSLCEHPRIFTVHKQLLCQKIPYFDKMFNGPFAEGTTQSATLHEDDPLAVESMLGWVYLDKIEIVDDGGSLYLNRYIHLFSLAEKYHITTLAD